MACDHNCGSAVPPASSMAMIPAATHEIDMDRAERAHKRAARLNIILAVFLLICNAIWLYAWTRYDYTSVTRSYTQDGQGINIIGDNNDPEQYNEPKASDNP